MIIRGVNLPLIIASIVILIVLIIFPLLASYKAEKKSETDEWDKIKKI